MFLRLLATVPLLAAAAAAPDATRYDVTVRGTALAVIARQGPDGVMQGEAQARNRSATATLSVTTADSAGLEVLTARLDTIVFDAGRAPEGAQVRGIENASGAVWRAMRTPGAGSLSVVATGANASRLMDDVVVFLAPRLPATLAAGMSWSDTLEVALEAGDTRGADRLVSEYRVTGGDAAAGWTLERAYSGERTVRGKTPSGDLLVETTLRGTVTYRLDPERRVSSARIVRNLDTTMHVPQLEMPLGAETSDTMVVTRRS